MLRKRKWLRIFTLLLVLSGVVCAPKANGREVHSVETNGSVGFTGTYVPIGTPDPPPERPIESPPVTEIAKPGGQLPQTNAMDTPWHRWLGIILLSYVCIRWRHKQKQLKNKQKAGIIR